MPWGDLLYSIILSKVTDTCSLLQFSETCHNTVLIHFHFGRGEGTLSMVITFRTTVFPTTKRKSGFGNG